jgi:hypothetical protein
MWLWGVLCAILAWFFVFRRKKQARLRQTVSAVALRKKVAVVGGGIAGAGCAFGLKTSGFDVTVFEKKSVVGGNANTHTFALRDGSTATCGLSVLAWPNEYFKTYNALLESLKIATEVFVFFFFFFFFFFLFFFSSPSLFRLSLKLRKMVKFTRH